MIWLYVLTGLFSVDVYCINGCDGLREINVQGGLTGSFDISVLDYIIF